MYIGVTGPPFCNHRALLMALKDSEQYLINKLSDLKWAYRSDIRDRVSLEKNFRQKFEVLNRVHLMDDEFSRLLEQIIVPNVYTTARTLRERNAFECDLYPGFRPYGPKLATYQLRPFPLPIPRPVMPIIELGL